MDMDERLHLDNTEYWRSDMQIIRIALHNINPIDVVPVICNLNLNLKISKKNISPDEARAITLETLHLKYPLDTWTHIYTDGSLTDSDEGALSLTCMHAHVCEHAHTYTHRQTETEAHTNIHTRKRTRQARTNAHACTN